MITTDVQTPLDLARTLTEDPELVARIAAAITQDRLNVLVAARAVRTAAADNYRAAVRQQLEEDAKDREAVTKYRERVAKERGVEPHEVTTGYFTGPVALPAPAPTE